MDSPATLEQTGPRSSPTDSRKAIETAIERAAHLLPAQGPITAFVHHNTLHAFENLDFDAAVRRGARMFGCHPYLPEQQYREHLTSGRIRDDDIAAVLLAQLGDRADELLGFLGTRFSLYRAILRHSLHDGPAVDLRWVVGDTNALNCFREEAAAEIRSQFIADTRQWVMRDLGLAGKRESESGFGDNREIPPALQQAFHQIYDAFRNGRIEKWSDHKWESFTLHLLWKTCEYGVQQAAGILTPPEPPLRSVRLRDGLLELTGEDADELVHELLIPFCAAYLDQGFSNWPLADRDAGMFATFASIYGSDCGLDEPWRRGLGTELRRHQQQSLDAIDSIRQSIEQMGLSSEEVQPFVTETLLSLRGFAGMLWQLECRADRVSRGMPPGTLAEFLAIRLILDRLATGWIARSAAGFRGQLNGLRGWVNDRLGDRKADEYKSQQRQAYRVFELAQLLNWRPRILATSTPAEWARILSELNSLTGTDRRHIFHLAYERKYRNETLDAVRIHCLRTGSLNLHRPTVQPGFQIVCCIDEREESFRRHLEEIHDNCETFGAAGFFAIPMYYRGAADAHYTPLCPVVIKPDHHVREEVVYSLKQHETRRRRARRTIGTVTHRVHIGSRTFTGGWIGSALLGSLATFPLVARTLFPRLTARLRGAMGGFVRPPEITRLHLERDSQYPPGPDKDQLGFTVDEMADTVERLLRDIGCTRNFARLFFVCGHGSASLNNPHEAAHDCGACAGGRGGPNARAFAQMANDKRVREIVAQRGLPIPGDTVFVGCYHNTCDDSVTWYDLDQIPRTHQDEFERAFAAVEEARKRDAHERCRRFESAPLDLSFEEALRHVEGRAEDLSQVRPEYGHATNALCFVGQRNWNRGLFLDRRAFLQSYDPTQDDERSTILERILQAVIPVCAGINLEYYFSFVDPVGYGCGTKLPHNITSLIGVMNGAGSDLRPGLPWQMVEIHEPVRLLFVIETTATAMKRIIADNEPIRKLCDGQWVQLAIVDPDTGNLHLYRDQQFSAYCPESSQLPCVSSSADWYRGWRGHLSFASIGDELGGRHGS